MVSFDHIDHEWLIGMLEQRADDRAFLQLIRKWLKAGILAENGKVIKPEAGTPQGGSISPVIPNAYLHYALDLWFEKVVKRYGNGESGIIRHADYFACLFQYRKHAERFFHTLPKRLAKFSLEAAPDKTRIIKFNRFRNKGGERFSFLGFEFYWGTSRNGRAQLYARTSVKKLRSCLAEFYDWIKRHRHTGNRKIFAAVNAKLRGHYNYFGIRCNYERLRRVFIQVRRLLRKWLNRRSQRRSCNWSKFSNLETLYRLELPRIVVKPPSQRQLFQLC